MDIDRIREDNEHRTDVERKAGLIIWSGRKPAVPDFSQEDELACLGT